MHCREEERRKSNPKCVHSFCAQFKILKTEYTMKKILNPWSSAKGFDCFGCSPDNPLGVHMEFFEDGDDVISTWHPHTHYQGWIDTLHGGIQSSLIVEIAAWVVFRRLQTTGVTSRMEVKFRRPIMTNEGDVRLRAHLVKIKRQLAFIHVDLFDYKGNLCTEGDVVYYTFDQVKD